MSYHRLSFCVAMLLWGTAGSVYAQTRAPLPPPESAAPAGLPPLPASNIRSTPPVSLPNTPPGQLPPTPGVVSVEPVATVDTTPKPSFNLEEFKLGMTAELQRLDQAIGSQLRVVGVELDSPAHRQAVGAAQQEKIGGLDPTVQNEINPGSILALGQYNGVGSAYSHTCVVVIDAERAAMAWEMYVLPPAQAGSHHQTGYAWMAAHAVGHCLDAQDRSQSLTRKLSWRFNEAGSLGLWPQAVQAGLPSSMGGGFAKDGFMNASERIYSQPSQRQFSERVADAFSALWLIRLGANPEGLAALAKSRMDHTGDDAGIVAVSRGRFQARAAQSPRADRLWGIAREAQGELGVDASRVASTRTAQGNALANRLSGEDEVVQWVVTPQGVMGIDAHGRLIQKPNTTQQVNPGRNFKNLPRFGQ